MMTFLILQSFRIQDKLHRDHKELVVKKKRVFEVRNGDYNLNVWKELPEKLRSDIEAFVHFTGQETSRNDGLPSLSPQVQSSLINLI